MKQNEATLIFLGVTGSLKSSRKEKMQTISHIFDFYLFIWTYFFDHYYYYYCSFVVQNNLDS